MMSTEHEQIVQRGFDAFETADMDAFTADWAPGRVPVLYTEWRRDPGETEPKPIEMAIIHTIEDGQVRHMQVHTSHESARRVAGVQ